MKRKTLIFVGLLFSASMAWAFYMPGGDNYCLDPSPQAPTATGYCVYVDSPSGISGAPRDTKCKAQSPSPGATKTCVGNSLEPILGGV